MSRREEKARDTEKQNESETRGISFFFACSFAQLGFYFLLFNNQL
jgi:hypothetical protein